jgi:hypothetical protein
MSQLLTEALQEVRWAEEQLEAAAAAVLARNGTHARNASAAPRLPPWAPASLILHWPAAREAANLSLPRLHRRRRVPAQSAQHAQPPRARRLLQLQGWVSEDEPNTGQQVMHHVPAAEPHQLAGVPELADFYSIKQQAWSRANHSGALGAAPCAGCAAGLACSDTLTETVLATAVLTCFLTLLFVWLCARRWRLQATLVDTPTAKQLAELPASEKPQTVTAGAGDAASAMHAPASDKV